MSLLDLITDDSKSIEAIATCERSGDRLAAFLVERRGGYGRFHLTMPALE